MKKEIKKRKVTHSSSSESLRKNLLRRKRLFSSDKSKKISDKQVCDSENSS
jgi:hypothetical protein